MQKGYGMCSGKALLAAEMHRAAGIAVRFMVVKIMGEEALFAFTQRWLESHIVATENKQSLLNSFRSLPPERDHIIVQVFINNQWLDLDLARDTDLDQGMRLIGVWRERRVLYREGPYDSLDGWLDARLKRRGQATSPFRDGGGNLRCGLWSGGPQPPGAGRVAGRAR